MSMYRSKIKINLFIYIGFNTLIIFLIDKYFNKIYGTADDWILDSLLTGQYNGQIETDLVFTSKFFSKFIGFLNANTNINSWYGISIFLIGFFSILVIYYLLILKFSNRVLNFFIIIALSYFSIWIFINPNYTTTSMLASITSFVLLYESNKENNKIYFLLSITFGIIGLIIRPEGFFGVSILFIPVLIFIIFKEYKYIKKFGFFALSIFFILILNTIYENKSEPELIQYREWAGKVQKLASRPTMYNLPKNLGDTNWTPSEYNLMVDLAYIDKKIYQNNWINSALDQVRFPNNYYELNLNNLESILSKWVISLGGIGIVILIVILLILFKENLINLNKYSLFYLSYFIVIQFLIALFLHSVARVNIPNLLILLIVVIYLSKNLSIQNRSINFLNYAVLIYLIIYSGLDLLGQQIIIGRNIENKNQIVNFINEYSNNVILIHGNQEFFEYSNPYDNSRVLESNNIFMVGNWDSFSPFWDKRAKILSLNPDKLPNELISNPLVFWSGPDVPNTTLNLQNYLLENNYSISSIINVGVLPNGNKIWDFS